MSRRVRTFNEVRPNRRISAAELNRAYDAIEWLSNAHASPGMSSYADSTGLFSSGPPQSYILGEILPDTSTSSGLLDEFGRKPYNWKQIYLDDYGNTVDLGIDGATGLQAIEEYPAFEINGNNKIKEGTKVRLWWGAGPWLEFESPASAIGASCLTWYTQYLHLSNIQVSVGDEVSPGQYLGDVAEMIDATDYGGVAHLHWGLGDGVPYRDDDLETVIGETVEFSDHFSSDPYNIPIASDHDPFVQGPLDSSFTEEELTVIKSFVQPPVDYTDTSAPWKQFQGSSYHGGYEYYTIDFALEFGNQGQLNNLTAGQKIYNVIRSDAEGVRTTVMEIEDIDANQYTGSNVRKASIIILKHTYGPCKEDPTLSKIRVWERPRSGIPTLKGKCTDLQFYSDVFTVTKSHQSMYIDWDGVFQYDDSTLVAQQQGINLISGNNMIVTGVNDVGNKRVNFTIATVTNPSFDSITVTTLNVVNFYVYNGTTYVSFTPLRVKETDGSPSVWPVSVIQIDTDAYLTLVENITPGVVTITWDGMNVRDDGSEVGTRHSLNFHEGYNIGLTIADDGASDEIDITVGWTGVGVRDTGIDIGTRRFLNFHEGAGTTLLVTDDAGNDEIDITISATGYSLTVEDDASTQTVNDVTILQFQNSPFDITSPAAGEALVEVDWATSVSIQDIGTSISAGTGTKIARADHVHRSLPASVSQWGHVSISSQSFAGEKDFTDGLVTDYVKFTNISHPGAVTYPVIFAVSSKLYLHTPIIDLIMDGTSGDFYPGTDQVPSLGKTSTNRWKDVWITGTYQDESDRRAKTQIQNCDLGLNLIRKLKPRKYRKKNRLSTLCYGLIADEVIPALQSLNHTETCNLYYEPDNPKDHKSLSYNAFIPILIKAIQELEQRIIELEGQQSHGY